MPIKLKCPKCGESYKVADDRAGRSFRCRKCQGAVKVPVDMFAATLDKMEMEMASEMESEGSALSVDELMALSEAGEVRRLRSPNRTRGPLPLPVRPGWRS
jgi:hypothetical protein